MEDYIIVETKTEGYKYKVTLTEVIYIEQVFRDGTGTVVANGGEGTTRVWTHTADRVHVTNGEVTLEVGSAVSGYSANNVSNWYVLGAQNGRLLITTNTNVANVALAKKNGYTGGVSKLNTEAAKYTNSDYAEGQARTINVDDINRVTGYDPDGDQYNIGNNIDQLGNEVVYTKKTGKIYYIKGINGIYPTSETSSTFTDFTYWTGLEWKTLEQEESTSAIKHTYYSYYPQTLTMDDSKKTITNIKGSSSAYSLLFANTSSNNYWLGSKYVYLHDGFANFGLRSIRDGYVRGGTLYLSYR